jgi:hypothetical protein
VTRIATSRYAAFDVIAASGLVPVGITVGRPKFPLPYAPRFMGELAPWGLLRIEDGDEFTRRYVARLDAVGADRLSGEFQAISAGHDGVVLLCFEQAGEPCHRRTFADWWEGQTGERVPELTAPTAATLF